MSYTVQCTGVGCDYEETVNGWNDAERLVLQHEAEMSQMASPHRRYDDIRVLEVNENGGRAVVEGPEE